MNGDTTSVLTGAQARKKVRAGVNKVFNAVKLTLGPEGVNALLPRSYNRGPRLTNDGVTVSENIKPKDEHERLAADFYKEGSKKTNEVVGDGTTTTAVIAASIMNEVFDMLIDDGMPQVDFMEGKKSKAPSVRVMRKEMKVAKDSVIAEIKKQTKDVKTLADLKKIAVVSIGKEDTEVAERVAELVWNVARDGDGNYVDNYVDVTEGHKGKIETEITKGMKFPAKVAHRAFVTKPERFEMVAEDVPVFITNFKMDSVQEVVEMLNRLQHPKIALFSPSFSSIVLTALLDASKKGMMCYPVLCPALRTEQLEDLAAYTGATVLDKEGTRKMKNVQPSELGFAAKLTVKDVEDREDATLMGAKEIQSQPIKDRIKVLQGQMTEAKNDMTKASLERRIANLQAAVGVVRVGASTNAELLYLKLKIEDGVFACKAALEEGYVKGGGLCLKEIAEKLPKSIITNALKTPYEQIQKNCGGSLEIADDVFDPAKVVRLEVEHGISVASSLITTGISVVEERDKAPWEGDEMVAKAIGKMAYYSAKHQGMLAEAEDEAESDREKEFARVMFEDKD
jgi:chaperonin GroEL